MNGLKKLDIMREALERIAGVDEGLGELTSWEIITVNNTLRNAGISRERYDAHVSRKLKLIAKEVLEKIK